MRKNQRLELTECGLIRMPIQEDALGGGLLGGPLEPESSRTHRMAVYSEHLGNPGALFGWKHHPGMAIAGEAYRGPTGHVHSGLWLRATDPVFRVD